MSFVQRVAMVGINRHATELLSQMLNLDAFQVVRIIDPAHESLHELETIDNLSIVIDATDDLQVNDKLHSLFLQEAEILTASAAKQFLVKKDTHLITDTQTESLKMILFVMFHAMKADIGAFILQDNDGQRSLIKTVDGRNIEVTKDFSWLIEPKRIEPIFEHGESILDQKPPMDSYVAVPFKEDGIVKAVLYLGSISPDRVFGRNDLIMVERIGECAVDVLQHSPQGCDTLISSAEKIMALPLDQSLQKNLVLMKMASVVGAKRCNYYSYDYEKNAFFREASSSIEDGFILGRVVKLNDLLAKKLLDTMGLVVMHTRDEKYRKWYLVQPLFVDENLQGALYAHLISNKPAMENDKEMFLQCCTHTAKVFQSYSY
ncbi:MAG: hypothetical protein ACOC4C_02155 [Fibrobacterota bacterium]